MSKCISTAQARAKSASRPWALAFSRKFSHKVALVKYWYQVHFECAVSHKVSGLTLGLRMKFLRLVSIPIHPASRGVAAHTAGLFRSVRGAKGGFPPWGLPKLRIFTSPPVGAPQAREFSLFPRGEFSLFPPVGAPQAREFSLFPRGGSPSQGIFTFPPVGAPQAREFSLFPPWGIFTFPRRDSFPSYGIFTFPSLGGSPSCGISNS